MCGVGLRPKLSWKAGRTLKGPRGPLKGPRGSLKEPRGPLKGPRSKQDLVLALRAVARQVGAVHLEGLGRVLQEVQLRLDAQGVQPAELLVVSSQEHSKLRRSANSCIP